MTTDRLSSAPPFRIGNTTFRCWVTDNGQRYEWRSEGDRIVAGRGDGALYWARIDGELAGADFPSPSSAMLSAMSRGRAAA